MKIRLIQNKLSNWVVRLIGQPDSEALVIYPFIFYGDTDLKTDLIAHELVHVMQIKKEGLIKWFIKYLYFYMTKGYYLNPYEIQARNEWHKYTFSASNLKDAKKKN